MHKPIAQLGLLTLGQVVASSGASAEPAQPRPTQAHERPPHPPPQVALDACKGKREGAACSFEAPDGTLDGTCRTVKDDYFACVPDGAPPPPPED